MTTALTPSPEPGALGAPALNLAPASPTGLVKLGSETWALYIRELRKKLRQPTVIFFSLIQPFIWLVLFGQIFSRIATAPGAAAAFGNVSYMQFFIPAVILQNMLFGAGQSGVGIITDIDSGFLDKLMTTPINRLAILLGRVLGDMTRMMIQVVIILVVGWVLGQLQEPQLAFYYGFPGILGALLIALMFGIMLAGFNVFIALQTRSTEATFLIGNFLTLPLLFVSSAQLPVELLPDWMQVIANVNPVTYAIDAIRSLLNGPAGLNRPTELAVVQALVIIGALLALTTFLATRTFRRAVSA